MQNYRFDIKLKQRHFPDCKIVQEPTVSVQVFYTDDYKLDSMNLLVGGKIIGRVGNWDKVVKEIEEVAAKAIKGMKIVPPPEYEDFENGANDRFLDDLHAVASAEMIND